MLSSTPSPPIFFGEGLWMWEGVVLFELGHQNLSWQQTWQQGHLLFEDL